MKAYKHKHAGDTWNVREYDLNEFMRAATDEPPHPKNADHSERDCQRGVGYWDTKWRGGTLEEAQTIRSWPAGRELLAQIDLGDLELPEIATTKRCRRWSDDGDEFDRDRFDAGYADCWQSRKRRRVRTGGNTIRLTIELSASWRKSAADLVWSGLAALKLADTLEDKGYRVEIDVVASNRGLNKTRSHNMVDIIRVKYASDPLNLDALLLSVANPLFYRFHVFASKLRRPVRCSGGLGHAAETPTGLRGDIHIAKVFTRDDAQRVVRESLKTQETE
jgi:hypothetical protein